MIPKEPLPDTLLHLKPTSSAQVSTAPDGSRVKYTIRPILPVIALDIVLEVKQKTGKEGRRLEIAAVSPLPQAQVHGSSVGCVGLPAGKVPETAGLPSMPLDIVLKVEQIAG